jgi:hypothetical protein
MSSVILPTKQVIANRGNFHIMQPFPLFIAESQTAKKRLLKIFELAADGNSSLGRDGVTQRLAAFLHGRPGRATAKSI